MANVVRLVLSPEAAVFAVAASLSWRGVVS